MITNPISPITTPTTKIPSNPKTNQADAEPDPYDGEDYPAEWVAEQRRLRETIDWEKPYLRDKPRNWDLITGLPVPRRIKIEEVSWSGWIVGGLLWVVVVFFVWWGGGGVVGAVAAAKAAKATES